MSAQPAEVFERLDHLQEISLQRWREMLAVVRDRLESLTPERQQIWRRYFEELVNLAERYKDSDYFPPEIVAHVKIGYQRVLFEQAYIVRPELPLRTKEDWDRLPDRWFDD